MYMYKYLIVQTVLSKHTAVLWLNMINVILMEHTHTHTLTNTHAHTCIQSHPFLEVGDSILPLCQAKTSQSLPQRHKAIDATVERTEEERDSMK